MMDREYTRDDMDAARGIVFACIVGLWAIAFAVMMLNLVIGSL